MIVNLESKENRRGEDRSFNLRKYFSLFSIGIILILTIVLSYVAFWYQKKALIDYSISTVEVMAEHFQNRIYDDFIATSLETYGYLYIGEHSMKSEDLDKIADSYLSLYSDILKFKIFDLSGSVVYSTDPEDVGTVDTSDKLMSALNSRIASKLTKLTMPAKGDAAGNEKSHEIDLLEVYVPIYRDINNPSQSDVIGAFEIDKDIGSFFKLMKSEIYKIPLMLIFSMSVLHMFLQGVVKKADNIISKQKREIERHNAELEEAQKRIKDSIEQVIENGSFHIRVQGTNLIKCWEFKKCKQTDCPGYQSSDLRCWQVAGTFCQGGAQGICVEEYGDCRECEIYQYAFKDRINMIGESFNNMMALLESKHKELGRLNEKLNELVHIDPLTQVGNRRSFQKRMENIHLLAIRYERPYSIILCDVDNFKLYNDTYGHQKGDDILTSIADTMKVSLRKTDEIFRWGGEEFVVILPEQNLSDALRVAENLRATVESLGLEHKSTDSGILTISAGVACNIAENVKYISWETVLKQADDSLYKAKSAGRNRVHPAMSISGTIISENKRA
ncbi:MAG TPA: GGDEF domain-containing protein [Nitrospirae bacterium]|nr:phytochrome-like protein cph2 [bacterium BMS3Abin06]HDH13012.1 GGDEF domain-containing protein [Nitrospirota bacterium]HDZ02936.1 GGDEF domain-containing protein [Nitrospirota bacterium]